MRLFMSAGLRGCIALGCLAMAAASSTVGVGGVGSLAQPASTAAASSAQRRQGEKDKGREGIMRASDKVRAHHVG
ncbi:hypothetical protein D3C78_603230 [compost metagenome]